eukprot:5705907-Pyramimonas_sp.AAC.1
MPLVHREGDPGRGGQQGTKPREEAAGRTGLPRPMRCFWAVALNSRPPIPYPHSFILILLPSLERAGMSYLALDPR